MSGHQVGRRAAQLTLRLPDGTTLNGVVMAAGHAVVVNPHAPSRGFVATFTLEDLLDFFSAAHIDIASNEVSDAGLTRVACSAVMRKWPHSAHDWEPQPGTDPVHCDGVPGEGAA